MSGLRVGAGSSLLILAVAGLLAAGPAAGEKGVTSGSGEVRVRVTAFDSGFELSRTSVPAGRVHFDLVTSPG